MSLSGMTFPCWWVYSEMTFPCWWVDSEWHSSVDESTWNEIPLLMSLLGMTFPRWWVYSEWLSLLFMSQRGMLKLHTLMTHYKFNEREKMKRLLYFRFIQETRKEPQNKKTYLKFNFLQNLYVGTWKPNKQSKSTMKIFRKSWKQKN
jgi:hypothetical protein